MTSAFEKAQGLATEALMDLQNAQGEDLILAMQNTIEVDEGWIFFYNTREYIEHGNVMSALAGNRPIFVNKSGEVEYLLTAISWQESLQRLRLRLQSSVSP